MHMKKQVSGDMHGYAGNMYLTCVKEELAVRGILSLASLVHIVFVIKACFFVCVTIIGIYMKKQVSGDKHGYPDNMYLMCVKEEPAVRGILSLEVWCT